MIFKSNNNIETKQLGRTLAAQMKGGEVICLYGDLGSGKTTFMNGFINFFLPGKRVLSPTFIIVRHYNISNKKIKNILHADLYRIEKVENIDILGLAEFMNKSDKVMAIEWAERLGKYLPVKRIDIKFDIISESKRNITMTAL
jgi:tRNA threonylcarbamoyladenosine biosynthesis protein TsaE